MIANLSPIGWALRPLRRYAEFSGRSSRAEFWWFMLALFVLYTVAWALFFGAVIGSLAGTQEPPREGMLAAVGIGGILFALSWLALLVPTIAVQVRRLHDTNRSGWWLGGFYLLYAVYVVMMFGSLGSMMMPDATAGGAAEPATASAGLLAATGFLGIAMFVYMIVLIVFYCLPGTPSQNRFGPDPYGQDVGDVFA